MICIGIFYIVGFLTKLSTNHDNSWISRGVPLLIGALTLVGEKFLHCQFGTDPTMIVVPMMAGYATPDRRVT